MGWTTIVKGGHDDEEWYYLLPVLHFLVVMETTGVETVKWILDCKSISRDVMIVSHYWDIELPLYLPTPMLLFKSGHEIPRASAHAQLCTGVKLGQAGLLAPSSSSHLPPGGGSRRQQHRHWPTLHCTAGDIWVDWAHSWSFINGWIIGHNLSSFCLCN